MLLKLVGVPQVTPLTFSQFATAYNIEYFELSPVENVVYGEGSLERRYNTRRYKKKKFQAEPFSDFRIIYCTSASVYNAVLHHLKSKKEWYFVFVSDTPTLLEENNIEILGANPDYPLGLRRLRSKDLKACLDDIRETRPIAQKISLLNTKALETISDIYEGSALHIVQPLFYRIKDLGERSFVQSTVFAYLAGALNHIGRAGDHTSILEALSNPKMQRLREACLYARKHSIDRSVAKYKIEKFEVTYLFNRVGVKEKG